MSGFTGGKTVAGPASVPGGYPHGAVIVLHGAVPADASPDEQDTLVQVEAVSGAFRRRGVAPEPLAATLNLKSLRTALRSRAPTLVFNLVESLAGSGRLIHLVPSLLEELDLPFTGAPAPALFLSTNKLLAKRLLALHGVPTPPWVEGGAAPSTALPRAGSWILKSVWEHASLGMDDTAVIAAGSGGNLREDLIARAHRFGGEWYAESYVEGREFNLSLLSTPEGLIVLPLAEIAFEDFPAGKPRIVGYRAKWEPDSFEYRHTVRRFLPAGEEALAERLRALALRCWELFGLAGYARVDFRVDGTGQPWVLEINANPGIAPDAGFPAAAEKAGIGYDDLIGMIADDALRRAAARHVSRS
jgi:D-alanine-D-alanine ligase